MNESNKKKSFSFCNDRIQYNKDNIKINTNKYFDTTKNTSQK